MNPQIRNIMIFTTIKFGTLYLIHKALVKELAK